MRCQNEVCFERASLRQTVEGTLSISIGVGGLVRFRPDTEEPLQRRNNRIDQNVLWLQRNNNFTSPETTSLEQKRKCMLTEKINVFMTDIVPKLSKESCNPTACVRNFNDDDSARLQDTWCHVKYTPRVSLPKRA